MNRRRLQPQLRTFESDDSTPRPPAALDDVGLDDDFFTRGSSELELIAVSERAREEDEILAARSRSSRAAWSIVAVGAVAIGSLGLLGAARRPPRIAASAMAAASPVAVERAAADPTALTPPEGAMASENAAAPEALLAPEGAADDVVDGDGQPALTDDGRTAAVADLGAPGAITGDGPAVARVVTMRQLRASAPSAPPEPAPAGPPPSSESILAQSAGEDDAAACAQLLRKGKFSDLKTACTRAFEAAPDASLAVKVARNALERERYTEAHVWSRRALELDAAHGEAFLTLGNAEQGLGHNTLARTAYARYLELEPRGTFADDVRALIDSL